MMNALMILIAVLPAQVPAPAQVLQAHLLAQVPAQALQAHLPAPVLQAPDHLAAQGLLTKSVKIFSVRNFWEFLSQQMFFAQQQKNARASA